MSFGYSVGDFLTGATVAIKMYHILATTKCSSIEHTEIMLELKILEETFNGIVLLSKKPAVRSDTLKGAELLASASAQSISEFLERTKTAREKMSCPGTGNKISETWRKMGWAIFKIDELKTLKDGLHERQSHIQMILQLAQLQATTPEIEAGDGLEMKKAKNADGEADQIKAKTLNPPGFDSTADAPDLKVTESFQLPEANAKGILSGRRNQSGRTPTKKNTLPHSEKDNLRASLTHPQSALSSPTIGTVSQVDKTTKFSNPVKWASINSYIDKISSFVPTGDHTLPKGPRPGKRAPLRQIPDIDQMSVDPLMMTPTEFRGNVRRPSYQPSNPYRSAHEVAGDLPLRPIFNTYSPFPLQPPSHAHYPGGYMPDTSDPNRGYFDLPIQSNRGSQAFFD